MSPNLETLYEELQQREEYLKEEIRIYENTTKIIQRVTLDAKLNEITKIMVRVQKMILFNLHQKFGNPK